MLVSLSYSTLGHCFNSYNCFGNFSSCTLVLLLSNLVPTSPSSKLWVHLAGGELGRLVGSNSRDFLGSLIKPFGVKFPFLPVCRHHCLGRTDLSVPAQLWGRRVLQLADAGDGLMQGAIGTSLSLTSSSTVNLLIGCIRNSISCSSATAHSHGG